MLSLWLILVGLITFSEAAYKTPLQVSYSSDQFNDFGEIHFSNLKGDDVTIENIKPSFLLDEIDSMLKVRIAVKLSDGVGNEETNKRWILCSVPKSSLLAYGTSIKLTIDHDGFGNLISISTSQSASSFDDQSEIKFDEVVNTNQPKYASGPDTAGFLEKIEKEMAQRKNQNVDNRSFFQKYWIYIAIFVVMMTISGGGQQ